MSTKRSRIDNGEARLYNSRVKVMTKANDVRKTADSEAFQQLQAATEGLKAATKGLKDVEAFVIGVMRKEKAREAQELNLRMPLSEVLSVRPEEPPLVEDCQWPVMPLSLDDFINPDEDVFSGTFDLDYNQNELLL